MNEEQLTAVLRSGKPGQHDIGTGWTSKQVIELWEGHASPRDSRNFRIFVRGETICITPRRAAEGAWLGVVVMLASWLAFVLVVMAAMWVLGEQPEAPADLEAQHECVRRLGEDCKL